MDGTHLSVTNESRGAVVPDGPDAISRIISFGHALRTISEYLSEEFFEGAPEPTLAMMHGAYDRLAARRPDFTPEEFTLLVMSTLLGRCTDPVEAKRFRRGAAAYILRAAPKLPDDYAPIIDDARRMMARERRTEPPVPDPVAAASAIVVAPEPAARPAPRPEPSPAPRAKAPRPEPPANAPDAGLAGANPYARDRDTLRRRPPPVAERRGASGFALSILVFATILAILMLLASGQ